MRERTSPMEQTEATCTKLEMVWGGACQTERADVVSPQAHSSHLETNPERAREKPRRASHVAGPRVHSEWLLTNVHISNILSTPSKHVGRNQWKERALLTPQVEALLEDLGPGCWHVCPKLEVDRPQCAILLIDNLLSCPQCVQLWGVARLAPGKKRGDGREEVSQRAGRLLRVRIWIPR